MNNIDLGWPLILHRLIGLWRFHSLAWERTLLPHAHMCCHLTHYIFKTFKPEHSRTSFRSCVPFELQARPPISRGYSALHHYYIVDFVVQVQLAGSQIGLEFEFGFETGLC